MHASQLPGRVLRTAWDSIRLPARNDLFTDVFAGNTGSSIAVALVVGVVVLFGATIVALLSGRPEELENEGPDSLEG